MSIRNPDYLSKILKARDPAAIALYVRAFAMQLEASHFTERELPVDVLARIRKAEKLACSIECGSYRNARTPPYDAATATGMYD